MAQLVAHLLCKQGVRGSSPLGSTAGQRPFRLVGEGQLSCPYPRKVLQWYVVGTVRLARPRLIRRATPAR